MKHVAQVIMKITVNCRRKTDLKALLDFGTNYVGRPIFTIPCSLKTIYKLHN